MKEERMKRSTVWKDWKELSRGEEGRICCNQGVIESEHGRDENIIYFL
jgi:hypothetical protein